MPLYEYKCQECRLVVAKLRSIELRDEDGTCSCGGSMKRIMSAPPEFRMKGGGTRGHKKLKYASIQERLNSKYGDNP